MTTDLVLCELQKADDPTVESYSPFCLKIHRALKAAALPYARRHANTPDAYKAINPARQAPVLLVDGQPIADSTRILQTIVALRPALFGGDLDPVTRAEAWLWEDYADTALNGYVVAARWLDDRNWYGQGDGAGGVLQAYFGGAPWPVRALVAPRVRARVRRTLVARDVWRAGEEACWKRLSATLDQLEARAPARGYWLGPALTVADVAMFAQLQSLRTALTPPQRDEVEKRATLRGWLDRVDLATRGQSLTQDATPRRLAAA